MLHDAVGFDLPADQATYQLVTTADRAAAGVSTVSGTVTWSATFTSSHTGRPASVPVSVVRFAPALGAAATAVAGARQTVPVTVQGSAADGQLAALTVSVSYDQGATWQQVAVRGGRVTVTNPAAGGSVSFKAEVTDRGRRTFTETVIDAYLTQ